MNKTVALHTLGCKLNFSETSSIGRLLENDGFEKKNFDEVADVYVINTCSVTENADKECRMLVRRIQRKAPKAMVVITGCYAQLKPKEIAEIPGVDLVLGAAEKFNIAHHLKEITKGDSAKICSCDIEDVNEFTASHSINDRTRIFLKVQDGCDYSCSFCTIPMARGKSRSDSISNVIANVEALAVQGAKEIVLTGINLGDFRPPSPLKGEIAKSDLKIKAKGQKSEGNFFSLIQELDKVEGIERFRISVDVIVGFPGETEEDFMDTFNFLLQLDISYLHVFTYSERTNTLAAGMKPVVPISIRHERNKRLRNLSYQKMQYFTNAHIGETRKVLFETKNKTGMMEGYTDNYIKITAPFNEAWQNNIIEWKI